MSRHDRAKSGFLDTLFTRSTKRGHRNTYSANGTRPISANDNDFDSQDVEIRVLRMTVEEINKKFHEILDDMNIPKDKRDPLMSKSMDEKRDMLRMHYKGKLKSRTSDLIVMIGSNASALTELISADLSMRASWVN